MVLGVQGLGVWGIGFAGHDPKLLIFPILTHECESGTLQPSPGIPHKGPPERSL